MILKIDKKTVDRKVKFLAAQARIKNLLHSQKFKPTNNVQFDELETFEHTKCKPLSVALMVEKETRRILGFEVSHMPAKGRLSKIALKKYGKREDFRRAGLVSLFKKTQNQITNTATITSDSCPRYPSLVRQYFPKANYNTVIGKRGCIVGFGELKKTGFDPLFSLNHTCAMFRANINRLARRTWCTTKKRENLRDHIDIYVNFHNEKLIN